MRGKKIREEGGRREGKERNMSTFSPASINFAARFIWFWKRQTQTETEKEIYIYDYAFKRRRRTELYQPLCIRFITKEYLK